MNITIEREDNGAYVPVYDKEFRHYGEPAPRFLTKFWTGPNAHARIIEWAEKHGYNLTNATDTDGNIIIETMNNITASGVRDPNRGTDWEGESWDLWWVLEPTNTSDDELVNTLPGIRPEGGGGAGSAFHRRPAVRRTRTRVLVTQSGGLDI